MALPNGWIGAQYALLSWDGNRWMPEFRAIPYDIEAFRCSNEDSGFLSTGILANLFLKEVICGKRHFLRFLPAGEKAGRRSRRRSSALLP